MISSERLQVMMDEAIDSLEINNTSNPFMRLKLECLYMKGLQDGINYTMSLHLQEPKDAKQEADSKELPTKA